MAPDDPEESEQNVYGNEARQSLMEDSEISAEEDAFMQGYDQDETEEEETTNEAYDAAFANRRRRRRKSDFDESELEEDL